jgi:hypothetical protein
VYVKAFLEAIQEVVQSQGQVIPLIVAFPSLNSPRMDLDGDLIYFVGDFAQEY